MCKEREIKVSVITTYREHAESNFSKEKEKIIPQGKPKKGQRENRLIAAKFSGRNRKKAWDNYASLSKWEGKLRSL